MFFVDLIRKLSGYCGKEEIYIHKMNSLTMSNKYGKKQFIIFIYLNPVDGYSKQMVGQNKWYYITDSNIEQMAAQKSWQNR